MEPGELQELLKGILEKDEKFFADMMEKHQQFATFCAGCHRNTAVGSRPFWHRYRRTLCERCGPQYIEFLKSIKAWNY